MAKSTYKSARKDSPRRAGTFELGALLPEVGGVAFRRFGFTQGALLSRWAEVVGPVYARWSVPEALRFPRGAKSGAVLTVRVEGPFALQFQHVAPQIVTRVNQILGHNAVASLRLIQGEVPPPAPSRQPPPIAKPDEDLLPEQMRQPLTDIKDDGLRAALADLAAQIALAEAKRKNGG